MARGPWLREKKLRIPTLCLYCGKTIYTRVRTKAGARSGLSPVSLRNLRQYRDGTRPLPEPIASRQRAPSHKGSCWRCWTGHAMPDRPGLRRKAPRETLCERMTCQHCGEEFWIPKWKVRALLRAGRRRKYCGLSCMHAAQLNRPGHPWRKMDRDSFALHQAKSGWANTPFVGGL